MVAEFWVLIDNTLPSLFLTEGQVDKYIPLNNKNSYIIHNCKVDKYKNLDNVLSIQVYTNKVPLKEHIYQFSEIYESAGREDGPVPRVHLLE